MKQIHKIENVKGPKLQVLLIVIAIVPFLANTVFLPFANRVEPFVLNLPFLLFWTCLWMAIGSFCLALMYWLDPENGDDNPENKNEVSEN